jgi:hypothetical protein
MRGEYVEVPLEELTKPKNGYTVMTDRWWATRNGNPLMYVTNGGRFQYPQANHSKGICDRIYPNYPAVFVPVAYVKPNPL